MSTNHDSMYQCCQRLADSTNVQAVTSHANVQCFKCNSTSSQQDQASQFSDSWSRSGCSATNVEFTVGSNNLQTAHLALSNTTKLATQLANSAPPSAQPCFQPPLLERTVVSSPLRNSRRCPHRLWIKTMQGPPTPPYDLVPKVCGQGW